MYITQASPSALRMLRIAFLSLVVTPIGGAIAGVCALALVVVGLRQPLDAYAIPFVIQALPFGLILGSLFGLLVSWPLSSLPLWQATRCLAGWTLIGELSLLPAVVVLRDIPSCEIILLAPSFGGICGFWFGFARLMIVSTTTTVIKGDIHDKNQG